MISFEDALRIVLDNAIPIEAETVALQNSLNRVLAQDVFSDIDMPPFDKSAVDGYACRMEDILPVNENGHSLITGRELRIIETIPAGKIPEKAIGKGQCSGIMTGAMVPAGADCVIMIENTQQDHPDVVRFTGTHTAANICYRAEDIRSGDLVLHRGTVIHPVQIAVLASVGAVNPLVSKMPRIAIIPTGNELVEPNEKPGPSCIRNSNAAQIEAQIREIPAIPVYLGIAPDDPESLRKTIDEALSTCDILLISGGVSMGKFDYVPDILSEAGIDLLFKSIAIQPGKPTVFGRKGNHFIFGLPGNPVSSFVQFELLVKPFLMKMSGAAILPGKLNLPLGTGFKKKKSDRKSFVPVNIRGGEIFPVEYHGSAHIHAYIDANAMMSVGSGITEIKKGEFADVRPL